MASGTIHLRTQVHALYFIGDMPFSEETLARIATYVGCASTDDVYLRDVTQAVHASIHALQPFTIEHRQAFEDDARADMRDEAEAQDTLDKVLGVGE